MRRRLKIHPGSRCAAISEIEVEVVLARPRILSLQYQLNGNLAELRIPERAPAARTDALWEHMCFEAFLRATQGRYYELNFSPSTEWAAYRFEGYRAGMSAVLELNAAAVEVETSGRSFQLRASLDLSPLRDLIDTIWGIGLSAVIEEANGRKSYWALAHPPGNPDFHHADCFALELPAA